MDANTHTHPMVWYVSEGACSWTCAQQVWCECLCIPFLCFAESGQGSGSRQASIVMFHCPAIYLSPAGTCVIYLTKTQKERALGGRENWAKILKPGMQWSKEVEELSLMLNPSKCKTNQHVYTDSRQVRKACMQKAATVLAEQRRLGRRPSVQRLSARWRHK